MHDAVSLSPSEPVQRRRRAGRAFYRSFGFVERFRAPADGEPIHVDLELDGMRFGIASMASTRDGHPVQLVQHVS